MRAVAFLASLSVVPACGPAPTLTQAGDAPGYTPDAGAGDGATDGEAPPAYPAVTPPAPKVVTMGGPVQASPKIVPVFFSSDDATTVAALADFASRLGQTSYWKAATSEYGVGAAVSMTPVHLTDADAPGATVDDAAIQSWLAAKLEAADPAFGPPDPGTVYALFYPAGVTVTLDGSQSCVDFNGYHQELALDASHGGASVAYAVVPRCPGVDGVSGLDAVTAVASHELIETATDPFPLSSPAYLQVDDAHFYWTEVLGGSEVADLCVRAPGALVALGDAPYVVQRTWSNAAALTGHDPCVPAPADTAYFNSAPGLGVVSTLVSGQRVDVDGVEVAVGASATIPLRLFSDAPTSGPWTVSARPAAGWTGELSFNFDRTRGADGDVLSMTVHVLGAGRYGREPFVVTSELGGVQQTWIGLVTN